MPSFKDMKTLLFILASLFLVSCSQMTDERHIFIEKKLQPYYNQFLKEAAARGIEINPNEITITFKDLSDKSICGLTVYDINTIYIDTASFCWNTDKKELVYHELGHLLLRREHDNTLVDGTIKSIMYSYGYILNIDGANKEYYLDELFNPKTETKLIHNDVFVKGDISDEVLQPVQVKH